MLRFVCLFFLSFHPLLGNSTCDETGCWSVAAEWLYFTPSFDQNAYVWDGWANDFGGFEGKGTRRGERQAYASAFRVEAANQLCDGTYGLTARYTHFSHSYFFADFYNLANQVLGVPAVAVLADNQPGNVAFDRDYRYYGIEGLFSLYRPAFCRLFSVFSAGVKFAHLHIKEKANYFDRNSSTRQLVEPDMRAWALGPAATCDAFFALTSCLRLAGRCELSFLASRAQSQLTVTGDSNSAGARLLLKDTPPLWHAIEGYDTRLGINFQKKWRSLDLEVQGGYELINERRIINRLYFVDDAAEGFSFNEWSDFTLSGPYLRMEVIF